MGLDRTIRFPGGATPIWEAIQAQLLRVGEPGQLRMIDGLPAFPDEIPTGDWKELRVATSGGMVTIHRGPGILACVIWGNADPSLETSWRKVIWSCAAAGAGVVDLPSGSVSADEFARAAGLSPE